MLTLENYTTILSYQMKSKIYNVRKNTKRVRCSTKIFFFRKSIWCQPIATQQPTRSLYTTSRYLLLCIIIVKKLDQKDIRMQETRTKRRREQSIKKQQLVLCQNGLGRAKEPRKGKNWSIRDRTRALIIKDLCNMPRETLGIRYLPVVQRLCWKD